MDQRVLISGEQPASHIRSLARGLRVLQAICTLGSSTLHDIHRVTGLPKPTLVRILVTLEKEGYVWRAMGDGLYRVSSRILELKQPIQVSDVVAEIAAPYMDRLSARAGWPADIAVYQDGRMVIGETTRRRSPLVINRLATTPRVHMLMSSLGRTYLAFCGEMERERILDWLRHSPDPYDRAARDPGQVASLIAEVRRRGYGLRAPGYSATPPEDDEFAVSLTSIAVPIEGNGRLFGCLSLVWIATAASEAEIVRSHLPRLQQAAAAIAQRLGSGSTIGTDPALRRGRMAPARTGGGVLRSETRAD